METWQNKHYTQSDFEQWESPTEIIDGTKYDLIAEPSALYTMAPAPGWYHQKLNLRICSGIDQALSGCTECEVNIPINWKISEDTIVQPDVVVVCKPFDKGLYLEKAPEIIFEIASATTSQKDRTVKYDLYALNGVGYYVIVSPIDKNAEVFKLTAQKEYASDGIFTNSVYHFDISGCSFDFDFGKIW